MGLSRSRCAARLGLGLSLALWASCRERAPDPPADRPADPAAPFRLSLDEDRTFVYADLGARFRQVRGAAAVPEASRRVVRVIEPTAKSSEDGDDRLVHVVDMSHPSPDRELETQVMTRAQFRRRAIAVLPPGLASRVEIPGGESVPGSYADHDRVIVYGTSWCGACRELRQVLRSHQVDFIDRDVERDVGAALEVAGKAASAGVVVDRVPIVDVRGTLLIGFDRDRLTTLLGDPI